MCRQTNTSQIRYLQAASTWGRLRCSLGRARRPGLTRKQGPHYPNLLLAPSTGRANGVRVLRPAKATVSVLPTGSTWAPSDVDFGVRLKPGQTRRTPPARGCPGGSCTQVRLAGCRQADGPRPTLKSFLIFTCLRASRNPCLPSQVDGLTVGRCGWGTLPSAHCDMLPRPRANGWTRRKQKSSRVSDRGFRGNLIVSTAETHKSKIYLLAGYLSSRRHEAVTSDRCTCHRLPERPKCPNGRAASGSGARTRCHFLVD